MKNIDENSDKKNIYYYVALYSGLGFTMVIFTILCMYLGIYLDKLLNTGYNFSLAFTIFGMGAGGWWAYRRAIKNALEDEKEVTGGNIGKASNNKNEKQSENNR